jgi:hypothetical protein
MEIWAFMDRWCIWMAFGFGFAWFVRLGFNLEEGMDWVGLGGNDYDSPFCTSGTEGKGGWHTDVHWHFGLHIALFYSRGLVKLNS